jgi:hypothetical protein
MNEMRMDASNSKGGMCDDTVPEAFVLSHRLWNQVIPVPVAQVVSFSFQ